MIERMKLVEDRKGKCGGYERKEVKIRLKKRATPLVLNTDEAKPKIGNEDRSPTAAQRRRWDRLEEANILTDLNPLSPSK